MQIVYTSLCAVLLKREHGSVRVPGIEGGITQDLGFILSPFKPGDIEPHSYPDEDDSVMKKKSQL